MNRPVVERRISSTWSLDYDFSRPIEGRDVTDETESPAFRLSNLLSARYTTILLALLVYPAAFVVSSFQFELRTAVVGAFFGISTVIGAAMVGALASFVETRQWLSKTRYSPNEIDILYDCLSTSQTQLDGMVAKLRMDVSDDGLQSTSDIARYELSCVCSSIWVVSRDLDLDLSGEEYLPSRETNVEMEVSTANNPNDGISFDEIVARNLHRGISYTYILPDTTRMRQNAASLRDRVQDSNPRGKLEVLYLSDDDLKLMPYTEGNFAIFFPFARTNVDGPRIQVEFPSAQKTLWISVTGVPATIWVDRVRPLVDVARKRLASEIGD